MASWCWDCDHSQEGEDAAEREDRAAEDADAPETGTAAWTVGVAREESRVVEPKTDPDKETNAPEQPKCLQKPQAS